ncbi:hypothetical protein MJI20_30195, partial [Salmonella enterica subsp. enterica serovar Anatum]|nr:hypothetical protein [Salmonella enterica subsp. enterica serovar Anatum]
NLDELRNDEMVIAVGSERTVQYVYQTKSEMIQNYFKIVDEANGKGQINFPGKAHSAGRCQPGDITDQQAKQYGQR